ncbi:MAG: class I SAM-dependent methyltransferase [Chitinophagaceae bacterium]|nr:MAG: class I SAM-dependent methyltransferase [Chitinophagaceae bacterium]
MAVERVEIDQQGSPWKEEHLARYFHIREKVKDKTVLDIACGTGFGSELLLQNGASRIFAADVSPEAIELCTKRLQQYDPGKWTCHYQDGTNMSYPSGNFDMVVSFETIEHIPDYSAFLSEIYRVLKQEGILVLSTPNALVTNPSKGKPVNPYHVYEFDPAELSEILSKYFTIELAAGHHVKENYGVAPFLPSFNRKTLTVRQKINFLYWRIALRLPKKLRDKTHRLFFSSDFYPRVEEYTFKPENLTKAHVQYYICRKKG